MGDGLAEANTVIGTNKATEEVARHHVITDAELGAIWNDCRDDDHGRIVRLLILMGQRREEVGALTRTELDLETGVWTIPRERTKNGLEHEVPLSASAVDIIETALSRRRHDLVFGEGQGGF